MSGPDGPRGPAFTPLPLSTLLGRIAHEWLTRRRILDLPPTRFFDASAGPDLSVSFLGHRAATPFGPAAGPHTQLAGNIVLAWLAGARIVELKTIQVLDALEIPRPCIDMEAVGYNVEWSQELRLDESLEEYVKAWMVVEILRGWDELRPYLGADAGPHLFDLSVGYDLAGVSSPAVAAVIDGLADASATIARLRPVIPEPFAAWRDRDFPATVIRSATLSTFHGCPPDEIAAIARHLMTRHGLDVVVKLNPTLLGPERVGAILHDELGYANVRLLPEAFAADLGFARAIELVRELDGFARAHGRSFGIKLTNTLVVANDRGRLPADPMYLSGPPLHALAVTLLDELHRALPGVLAVGGASGPARRHDGSADGGGGGTVQVSFSAGVTKGNAAAMAGLGIAPISVCSDLLRPGGYGRLRGIIGAVRERLTEAGCADLAAWRAVCHVRAVAAGELDAVTAYAAALRTPGGRAPYVRGAVERPLRHVARRLTRWDCVACNVCVTVCPNDAFFHVPSAGSEVPGDDQYAFLAELCNRCGNCEVFCPQEGDPAAVKPALFLDPARFAADDRAGFLLARDEAGAVTAIGRPGLEADADVLTALFRKPGGLPLDPAGLAPAAGQAGVSARTIRRRMRPATSRR